MFASHEDGSKCMWHNIENVSVPYLPVVCDHLFINSAHYFLFTSICLASCNLLPLPTIIFSIILSLWSSSTFLLRILAYPCSFLARVLTITTAFPLYVSILDSQVFPSVYIPYFVYYSGSHNFS